jgi:hypothetical protein
MSGITTSIARSGKYVVKDETGRLVSRKQVSQEELDAASRKFRPGTEPTPGDCRGLTAEMCKARPDCQLYNRNGYKGCRKHCPKTEDLRARIEELETQLDQRDTLAPALMLEDATACEQTVVELQEEFATTITQLQAQQRAAEEAAEEARRESEDAKVQLRQCNTRMAEATEAEAAARQALIKAEQRASIQATEANKARLAMEALDQQRAAASLMMDALQAEVHRLKLLQVQQDDATAATVKEHVQHTTEALDEARKATLALHLAQTQTESASIACDEAGTALSEAVMLMGSIAGSLEFDILVEQANQAVAKYNQNKSSQPGAARQALVTDANDIITMMNGDPLDRHIATHIREALEKLKQAEQKVSKAEAQAEALKEQVQDLSDGLDRARRQVNKVAAEALAKTAQLLGDKEACEADLDNLRQRLEAINATADVAELNARTHALDNKELIAAVEQLNAQIADLTQQQEQWNAKKVEADEALQEGVRRVLESMLELTDNTFQLTTPSQYWHIDRPKTKDIRDTSTTNWNTEWALEVISSLVDKIVTTQNAIIRAWVQKNEELLNSVKEAEEQVVRAQEDARDAQTSTLAKAHNLAEIANSEAQKAQDNADATTTKLREFESYLEYLQTQAVRAQQTWEAVQADKEKTTAELAQYQAAFRATHYSLTAIQHSEAHNTAMKDWVNAILDVITIHTEVDDTKWNTLQITLNQRTNALIQAHADINAKLQQCNTQAVALQARYETCEALRQEANNDKMACEAALMESTGRAASATSEANAYQAASRAYDAQAHDLHKEAALLAAAVVARDMALQRANNCEQAATQCAMMMKTFARERRMSSSALVKARAEVAKLKKRVRELEAASTAADQLYK